VTAAQQGLAPAFKADRLPCRFLRPHSADKEQMMTMMKAVLASAPILAAALLLGTSAHAQDVSAGERSFNKCRACHQLGETAKNTIGPVLNGLFGRSSGSVEGYSYSPANKAAGLTWDDAVFADYIKDPKAKVPGTKMIFAGIKNEQEIKDLAAYLKQFDKDGKKL
jgi:cytochrome c